MDLIVQGILKLSTLFKLGEIFAITAVFTVRALFKEQKNVLLSSTQV